MSGILYVVMAILVILVVTTLVKWARATNRWVNSELNRLKDRDTFKMRLDAKNQQIADIRRDTEDEMRRRFKGLVDSLHSEIDELYEERSSLHRTINLQGDQLEKLEDDLKLCKMVLTDTFKDFIALKSEESELSGICINGVPLTRKELALEFESGLQADHPSTWLYGDNDLLTLPSYDHLYDREVSSDGREWHKFEKRKDNPRQSSYRQVSIDLRKARKLVGLQNYEGGE